MRHLASRAAEGDYDAVTAALEIEGVEYFGRPDDDHCHYFGDPDGCRLELAVAIRQPWGVPGPRTRSTPAGWRGPSTGRRLADSTSVN